MPLRSDILNPIPGTNPAGQAIRRIPIYEQIREALREDDQLAQGDWQHDRKMADHALAIRLCQEAIAVHGKDLQVAAWLCESLAARQGFAGAVEGLSLCHGLLDRFWDHLYPELDDGDAEERAIWLSWLSDKMEFRARMTPLCRDEYGLLAYKASRTVVPEDQAKTKEQKSAREAALKDGKIPPEVFDRSFTETPKAFYAQTEKDLEACFAALKGLDEICVERFKDASPSFARLHSVLEEVERTVKGFLKKKRETEPDPEPVVEPPKPEPGPEPASPVVAVAASEGAAAVVIGAPVAQFVLDTNAPADQRQAVASIAAAAAFLRKSDPYSPAPYLMLRGLRWGELRASRDPWILLAAPTEIRQRIKALALDRRWAELLEAAENVMAQPYGRAWLDLQRFVIEACVGLGSKYEGIAVAIRTELRALLSDLPELLNATLTDDTPAANPQTQTWLKDILAEPAAPIPDPNAKRLPVLDNGSDPGWQRRFPDAQLLASEAMRQGQPQKAFEILNREIERQRSGRGRFQRKLQLAQICITAGKENIAQPLVDDLVAAVEAHKLEEWEDRETIAGVLLFLMQSSKKIQGDAKLKQAMFERICRLDPVQALSV